MKVAQLLTGSTGGIGRHVASITPQAGATWAPGPGVLSGGHGGGAGVRQSSASTLGR